MCSIMENTKSDIIFHLVHDVTLTEQNRARFLALVQRYGQVIKFHDAQDAGNQLLDKGKDVFVPEWLQLFTIADFYRLFLWDILPPEITRVIYLDADIIANMDVSSVWKESVGSNGLAAVEDPSVQFYSEKIRLLRDRVLARDRYFNAGMLLMERKAFCEHVRKLVECGFDFLRQYPDAQFPDQDVLNFFYGQDCCLLPEQCNTIVSWKRFQGCRNVEPAFYHYSGHALTLDLTDEFNSLFFRYFMKTPWADESFLQRVFSIMPQIYDLRTEALRRIGSLFAHRQRIVYGKSEDEDRLRRILGMSPDEPYVRKKGPGEAAFLLQRMMRERGRQVWVLFSEDYPKLAAALKARGYVENEDFLDGGLFAFSKDSTYKLDEYAVFQQL